MRKAHRKGVAPPETWGTYDEIVNVLIDLVPSGDEEGEYSDEFRSSLLRSLADIRHGRVYSSEDVRRRLGLKS